MGIKKSRTLGLFVVFALALAALGGCGNGSGDSGQTAGGGTDGASAGGGQDAAEVSTLVYGSGDYSSINPALYEHGEINSLLFLGLTAHDKDANVVPGLASGWVWDEAAKTYTFTLREGLSFHDGQPLTSADVKFTFETIMDEANGSENISNYEDIVSIDTPDERTVVFALSAPNAAMPDYLAMGILPKHLLEGKNIPEDEFNQNPVGAGPYRLVSWDMGQSIVMEKFEDFCMGAPEIDRIVFKIVPDGGARALQLRTGELDLAQVTPKDAEAFRGDTDFEVYAMDTADYRGILYNFHHAFWKENPGLPAALSYAVDRETIVRTVLLGQGETAYSPLQKGPYNNPDAEHYYYNTQKAKAEIEKLGWQVGAGGYFEKGGEPLAFAISVRPNDQARVDMANICAQNFRDIGVNATVEIHERTDWAGQQAFLIGWGSPFDPDDHTYKVFGTDKGANFGGYSNARVDELLTRARAEEGRQARMALYGEFQAELARDPAYTFLVYIDALYVARQGLSGIAPDTVLGHHGVGIFWNVWEWGK